MPKSFLHNPLEGQMLSALELFHYANRFRGQLFLFAYDPNVDFEETITDLRVVESTNIRAVLLMADHPELTERLARWNTRGSRFEYIPVSLHDSVSEIAQQVLSLSSPEITPIIAVRNAAADNDLIAQLDEFSLSLARAIRAHKIFMVTEYSGLQVHHVFHSHPSIEDIEICLEKGKGINIGEERLRRIQEERKKFRHEIVLLGCESGAIFEEIFTHKGRGTLFTDSYPNVLRKAIPSDTKEIALLIKADVAEGLILPISEEEIFGQINNFYVYTINDAVVASAKLTNYGSWAELAKFCTLPRYQRKGKAYELGLHMIGQARAQGSTHVFALSIVPKMWEFFLRLGLNEIDRKKLPEEWKSHYDFSRPSKAFFLEL